MTEDEFKVKAVTQRLQDGGPLRYVEIFRDDIVNMTIKNVRPLPIFKWLDICPIDIAAKVLDLGHGYRSTEAFKVLHAYHCKFFFSIPKAIRRRVPELVREVLKGGGQ